MKIMHPSLYRGAEDASSLDVFRFLAETDYPKFENVRGYLDCYSLEHASVIDQQLH